jgi:hypothetical protein
MNLKKDSPVRQNQRKMIIPNLDKNELFVPGISTIILFSLPKNTSSVVNCYSAKSSIQLH